jgi:uncharacterized membrane protein YdbT with pleckstrin-like domain
MSDSQNGELSGENMIRQYRLHIIVFLYPVFVILFITLIIAIAIGWAWYHDKSIVVGNLPYIVVVSGGVILMSSVPLINWLFKFMTTTCSIFNDRVTYRTGFISRQVISIAAADIVSVGLEQSLLGRFLQYGSVAVMPRGYDKIFINMVSNAPLMVEDVMELSKDYDQRL